jgi:hypothetical protein
MEIAKGSIGPETTYESGIKDGKATASVTYVGADLSAGANISVGLDKLLDAAGSWVKKVIPGTSEEPFVDMVVQAIKNALK